MKKKEPKSLPVHCGGSRLSSGRQRVRCPGPWLHASLWSRKDPRGMDLTLTAPLLGLPEEKPALPAPDPELVECNLRCSGKG